MKSFAPEVLVVGSNKWTGNALRFATEQEATKWVIDLSWRWTAVTDTRVVESEDPVNYKIENHTLSAVAV
jgi:hypothetical protein